MDFLPKLQIFAAIFIDDTFSYYELDYIFLSIDFLFFCFSQFIAIIL